MVTATVCLEPRETRRISIGSSVARESGLRRARPSSTTRTRALVLLPRRSLSPVFSSIRFSARSRTLPVSLAPRRASILGYAEAHGTAACRTLPRGDRGKGRREDRDPLRRPRPRADDERPPRIRRRGRGRSRAAAPRPAAAEGLTPPARAAGSRKRGGAGVVPAPPLLLRSGVDVAVRVDD